MTTKLAWESTQTVRVFSMYVIKSSAKDLSCVSESFSNDYNTEQCNCEQSWGMLRNADK